MGSVHVPFYHGGEENGGCACTGGNSTAADQSEIRKVHLVSADRKTGLEVLQWNDPVRRKHVYHRNTDKL